MSVCHPPVTRWPGRVLTQFYPSFNRLSSFLATVFFVPSQWGVTRCRHGGHRPWWTCTFCDNWNANFLQSLIVSNIDGQNNKISLLKAEIYAMILTWHLTASVLTISKIFISTFNLSQLESVVCGPTPCVWVRVGRGDAEWSSLGRLEVITHHSGTDQGISGPWPLLSSLHIWELRVAQGQGPAGRQDTGIRVRAQTHFYISLFSIKPFDICR